MKKRFFALFLMIVLCAAALIPARAADTKPPRLVDGAGVLGTRESEKLLEKLDKISEKHQVDIVILTVKDLGGKLPRDVADDFFDYSGYGFGSSRDGILLLLCPTTRDWYVSTTGFGIRAVTDAGLDYMSERFLPSLKKENYAKAFNIFADQCDKFIRQALTGEPYDYGHLPMKPLSLKWIPISLVVGFVIAFIVVGSMKSQLTSVRSQSSANSYIRAGSTRIDEKSDLFLYHTVDRRARPKDTGGGGSSGSYSRSGSSTHTSSSGTSHGGGGGKY